MVVLSAAIVRVVAGVRCLRYRSRTFAIVALSSGVLTILTGYCLPTGLALLIWGLVVLMNESTVRAFTLGDQGMSLDEISTKMASDPQKG